MSGYIPTYGGLEHHDYFTLHPQGLGPERALVCRSGVQIVCMSAWGTQGTGVGGAVSSNPAWSHGFWRLFHVGKGLTWINMD